MNGQFLVSCAGTKQVQHVRKRKKNVRTRQGANRCVLFVLLVVIITYSSVSSNHSVALLVDSAALLFEYRKKTLVARRWFWRWFVRL